MVARGGIETASQAVVLQEGGELLESTPPHTRTPVTSPSTGKLAELRTPTLPSDPEPTFMPSGEACVTQGGADIQTTALRRCIAKIASVNDTGWNQDSSSWWSTA